MGRLGRARRRRVVRAGEDGLRAGRPRRRGSLAAPPRGAMTDFSPRRDVLAISHVNVVVDDIEVATEFYCTVLGFEQAANADGTMDYPGVDLASFARDAGFDDGRVSLDVRFLKHPEEPCVAGSGVTLLDSNVASCFVP